MLRKLPTLLKINAMMKQKAERSYADLVRQRSEISNQISSIIIEIEKVEKQLFLPKKEASIQIDFQTFETWKVAQRTHIQNLIKADKLLVDDQVVLKTELGHLIVRETQLEALLQKEKVEAKGRQETVESEEAQKIWLHLNN